MTIKNGKKFDITLVAYSKSNCDSQFCIKEPGATTLMVDKKSICLFLNEEDHCVRNLNKWLKAFVSSQKYDVNIDIDSILNIYSDKKELTFKNIIETVLFETHEVVLMKKESKPKKSINFIYLDSSYDAIYEETLLKMEYLNFARDLQDLPPNIGTSVEIAKRIEEKAKKIANLKVTVYTKKQIEEMNMGLLLSVNAGSHVEPRVVVLEYVGDASKEKVALVGKGICFDSGGYNLKPSMRSTDMKFDMSGAAIMSATVMALAASKAKCNVASVAMLTDNRIGGKATLPDSIIKSMNGLSVQIDNTDAEGRLVLADGITYSIRNLKANKVIDLATLTWAIGISLGPWFVGAFSTDDGMWNELLEGSYSSLERVWRLPLIKEHLEVMQKTPIADLTNSKSSLIAGSSKAAAFLNEFAENKPFLHLDIAGTAYENSRGNGIMLKTLFEMYK